MIWSPFYGVSGFGEKVTGWMNRLLIGCEAIILTVGLADIYSTEGVSIVFIGSALLVYAVFSILNFILWFIWRVLFVLYHGSADPQVIEAKQRRKEEKRRQMSEEKSTKAC